MMNSGPNLTYSTHKGLAINLAEHRSTRNYFRRQAKAYEKGAVVQFKLAEQLAALAAEVAMEPQRIIELGAGGGALTHRLTTKFPAAEVTATDIFLPEQRFESPQVTWEELDMDDIRTTAQYDLAASNCALHWAESLPTTLRRIRSLLQPNGKLVATVMTSGTLTELHELRAVLTPNNLPCRRLPALDEVRNALEQAGFQIERWIPFEKVETYPSPQELLAALRRSAFTGGEFAQAKRPLTRSELTTLCRQYRERFGDEDGAVPATYEAATVATC